MSEPILDSTKNVEASLNIKTINDTELDEKLKKEGSIKEPEIVKKVEIDVSKSVETINVLNPEITNSQEKKSASVQDTDEKSQHQSDAGKKTLNGPTFETSTADQPITEIKSAGSPGSSSDGQSKDVALKKDINDQSSESSPSKKTPIPPSSPRQPISPVPPSANEIENGDEDSGSPRQRPPFQRLLTSLSVNELFYKDCQNGDIEAVRKRLIGTDGIPIDLNKYTKTEDTPLCVACVEERFDIVKLLLDQPTIQVNLCNYSHPPLALAAGLGRLELVRLLLAHPNIDVNVSTAKRTPLTAACEKGHLEVIQLLCEHDGIKINALDQHGHTALFAACLHGHIHVVEYLVTRPDLDVNLPCGGDLPLTVAASYHRVKIIKILLTVPTIDVNRLDQDGFSAIVHACEEGLDDIVKIMLTHPNIQIEDGKKCALTRTVEKGHARVLRLLLEIHPITSTCYSPTELSLATVACQRGHLEIVQVFLEKNIFQNDSDDMKRIAVYEALANHHPRIARLLILERTDFRLEHAPKGQATLLHAAAGAGYEDIVTALIPYAGDIGAVDAKDRTALQIAAYKKHWNVALILILADLPFQINQDEKIELKTSERYQSWMELADPNGPFKDTIDNIKRNELTRGILLNFPETIQKNIANILLDVNDISGRVVKSFIDPITLELLTTWEPSESSAPSPESRKKLRTPGAVSVVRTDSTK